MSSTSSSRLPTPAVPKPHLNNDIDFAALANEHGYVKARQELQRVSIKSQQKTIEVAESELNVANHPLRIKEARRLGTTFGNLRSDSMLERILKTNSNVLITDDNHLSILNMLKNSGISLLPGESKKMVALPKGKADQDSITEDHVIRHAMTSATGELLFPNVDADAVPLELGDTLALQLAYVHKFASSRNNMRSMITTRVPQLSMYHMRYITEINMAFNKLKTLPSDIGVLANLQKLNLAENMIGKLPDSVSKLKKLRVLNLTGNSFATLPHEFCYMTGIEELNLSNNLFADFPHAVTLLKNLKKLNLSRNTMLSLAIQPPFLKKEDMWKEVIDKRIGKMVFVNILTKERVRNIELYSGSGMKRAANADLHVFQTGGHNTVSYKRRKMWLSICQVPEWETAVDNESGLFYYKNNVSGETSWTMPAELDLLGTLVSLEDFIFNNNNINSLPESFTNLVSIKKVILSNNKINALPENIGALKTLECFDVSSNELKILPVSLCDCEAMVDLRLNDNHLLRLPDNLGYLKNLEKLNISVNRMKQVPFTLGFCHTLTFINVSENPLIDPPFDEFTKGIDHIRWYCRNRFHIEGRGMPPEMQFQTMGAMDEVTILKPEFHDIIAQMVKITKPNDVLNLQLLGLREIPREVIKMKSKLKKLKLDFNPHLTFFKDQLPKELNKLVSLSFQGCQLPYIPDNIWMYDKLVTLNLVGNQLESLPDGTSCLTNLTHLDLSKNRLYNLPEGIENLSALKMLNLESNNIETLHEGLGKMDRLQTLILSKNRIADVPAPLCNLTNLKVLNLEKNKLYFLPGNMRNMNLVDLKVGHNMIEIISDDLFSGNLKSSLKFFSCCENNLMELPTSLWLIDKEAALDAEYNPLVSPPTYLLAEGLKVVQHYLRIRMARIMEFDECLMEEDFEFDPEAVTPIANEVLLDGTGYLTPDDLAEFDQAVDEFINGEFYQCPASAQEMVATLSKLREDRETELYLLILEKFLTVLKDITTKKKGKKKDKRYQEAVLYQSTRPWGRKGEKCNVWVVCIDALLNDIESNDYHNDGRASIFNLIAAAMPKIAFPFTIDMLKDACRLYVSPYGQVAEMEEGVKFPKCECIDAVRNRKLRHKPCIKPALVLCKSIYVDEEATRREIEEDEFLLKFEAIEEEIRIWLVTEEGKRLCENEVKRRKQVLKEEIRLRDEMLAAQTMKKKKALQELKAIEKRKFQLEIGEGFDVHGYNDMSEAIQEQTEADSTYHKFSDRCEVLSSQILGLKVQLNMDKEKCMMIAGDDLVQKYCVKAYHGTVNQFRKHAAKHKLSRHWDGEDGEAYEKWLVNWVDSDDAPPQDEPTDPLAALLAQAEQPVGKLSRQSSKASINSDTTNPDDLAEYDFRDTGDMEKFKLQVYSLYRRNKEMSLAGMLDKAGALAASL